MPPGGSQSVLASDHLRENLQPSPAEKAVKGQEPLHTGTWPQGPCWTYLGLTAKEKAPAMSSMLVPCPHLYAETPTPDVVR